MNDIEEDEEDENMNHDESDDDNENDNNNNNNHNDNNNNNQSSSYNIWKDHVTTLFDSLPPYSHHKSELVSTLSPNISTNDFSSLSHLSTDYITHAKKKHHNDITEQKYSSNIKRQKISNEVKENLVSFLDTTCPVKSGRDAHYQYDKNKDLYTLYKKQIHKLCENYNSSSTSSSPIPPIKTLSFNTFIKEINDSKSIGFTIRRVKTYWGQFDCLICYDLGRRKKIISYSFLFCLFFSFFFIFFIRTI